jgi:integrase/recombinase XerD
MKTSNKTGLKNYLLKKGCSTNTVKGYVNESVRFDNWIEKENVSQESVNYGDVLHYIQIKKRTVKQSTISRIVNSLKHYFDYLQEEGVLEENPTTQISIKGVKRKTLYQILKPKELEQLYTTFEIPTQTEKNKNQNWFKTSQLTAKRNKVMLGLMIWQGLNAMELFRLSEKDIKLHEGKVFVPGSRRSNERTLKLESVQMMDLMSYIHTTRKELLNQIQKAKEEQKDEQEQTTQLFISAGKSQRISNVMQKLMEKLKSQNINVENAKQIRTSVITGWLKHNSLREVQYRAGHRYVSSTESYLVNDLEDLQEDITKFHPIV